MSKGSTCERPLDIPGSSMAPPGRVLSPGRVSPLWATPSDTVIEKSSPVSVHPYCRRRCARTTNLCLRARPRVCARRLFRLCPQADSTRALPASATNYHGRPQTNNGTHYFRHRSRLDMIDWEGTRVAPGHHQETTRLACSTPYSSAVVRQVRVDTPIYQTRAHGRGRTCRRPVPYLYMQALLPRRRWS